MKRWLMIGAGVLLVLAVLLVARNIMYNPEAEAARLLQDVRVHIWRNAPNEGNRDTLLKALSLDPENPEIMLYLGYVYIQLGQPLEALPVLEKARQIDHHDEYLLASIRFYLSQSYLAAGRYSEIFNLFIEIMGYSGRLPDEAAQMASNGLALVFGSENPYPKNEGKRFLTALNLYNRDLYSVVLMTLEEGEPLPPHLYLRALCHYHLGQMAKAQEALALAVPQSPDLALAFGCFPGLEALIPLFPDPQQAQWALESLGQPATY